MSPNNGQERKDAADDEEINLAPADRADDAKPKDGAQDDPIQRAADAEARANEINDRFLRLAAELENTRRRAEREKADASRYAIANFARDLLGVADNFERALAAAGDDKAKELGAAAASVIDGLRMTEKELLSVLERHGVVRVFPRGEKFDPNLHQAVAQTPSDEAPPGHVVDVAQSGFLIGDRVLRAAMVTVSTGPAAKEPPLEGSDDKTDQDGPHIDVKL